MLEPTDDFAPLGPGAAREITMDVELWAILKSDAPAGWHIIFDGGPARWVPAKTLLDASDPKQTTVFSGDKRAVETPATRFAQNTAPKLELELADRILPRPLAVEPRAGRFRSMRARPASAIRSSCARKPATSSPRSATCSRAALRGPAGMGAPRSS